MTATRKHSTKRNPVAAENKAPQVCDEEKGSGRSGQEKRRGKRSGKKLRKKHAGNSKGTHLFLWREILRGRIYFYGTPRILAPESSRAQTKARQAP
jgi:hypothetical protein